MEVQVNRPKSKQKKKRESKTVKKAPEQVPVASSSDCVDVAKELINAAAENAVEPVSVENNNTNGDDLVQIKLSDVNDLSVDETETSQNFDKISMDETGELVSKSVIETEIQKEEVEEEKSDSYFVDVSSINEFVDALQLQRKNSVVKEVESDLKLVENKLEIPEIQCHSHQVEQEEEIVLEPFTDYQLASLYENTEYGAVEQFITDFVESELKGISIKQHPLHELLVGYLQERRDVVRDRLQIDQNRNEYSEAQGVLWTLSSSVVSGKAECTDGNSVTATQTFTKATFHRSTFQTITRILSNIRYIADESFSLHSYSSEISKLNIDLYIQRITNTCLSVTQINTNSPVSLSLQTPPKELLPHLYDLRCCISILFAFQRKLIRDTKFVEETREWLRQLIGILLRIANWQDHLFILNHLLRCPPRVGNWAANFLQIPLNIHNINGAPFNNYEINHILAVLAVILLPIEKRDQFLYEFSQQINEPCETLWVLVDSEGEEDESSGTFLRENDLVAFLNQLPLAALFRAVLSLESYDKSDRINITSPHQLLRLFSFSTFLLRILSRGLHTYDHLRYNQLCKRLCRLIRHTVDYVTDVYEAYNNGHLTATMMTQPNNGSDVVVTQARLQTEYDVFFMRAAHALYTTRTTAGGAWQFLAVLPYRVVSLGCLWKVYYRLHEVDDSSSDDICDIKPDKDLEKLTAADYSNKLLDDSLRVQFQEKLSNLGDGECYYLLNTFANMALARDIHEMDFIQSTLVDLLQIGYIWESTQDSCSKNCRILLTHLTSKHPHLLSHTLRLVHTHLATISVLSLHLYEELPISVWRPTHDDLDTIARWLTHSAVNSTESKLARMILARLNWNLLDNYYLFLPHGVHCEVALLAVRAAAMEPLYVNWAWQTVMRLKLHVGDKGHKEWARVREVKDYDVLAKGIRENQPLAHFVSLLMTTAGHMVPVVTRDGLDHLTALVTQGKYEAVLFSLNLIVPLFIDCQELLVNSEPYQNILQQLLNADRGYINYARSFITTQMTVLEQCGNLIECQIAGYAWYNLPTPKYLTRIWLNTLVSLPSWSRDPGVMYLLDVTVRASFFHADSLDTCSVVLNELLQCVTPQEQSSALSSLFKWAGGTAGGGNLLISTSLSAFPWLAYVLIGLEWEERERSTGVWREVLGQLEGQKGRVNVDLAIKKATNKLKLPSFTSGSLCIFRWAQQALDTPMDHPLLPLLWQKFFELYLYRLENTNEINCLGEKFFEGLVNSAFQKRLKKRLQDTVEHYKDKIALVRDTECEQKPLYNMCLKLFTAYNLWLDEPRLHDATLHLPGLPSQYEPQLLGLIFQRSSSAWLEYVDYTRVKLDQQLAVKTWRCANYRERSNVNLPLPTSIHQQVEDPVGRIVKRLASYDTPTPPPEVKEVAPILPRVNVTDKAETNASLNGYFKTVFQFAHNYNLRVAEQTALDCTYQELVPQLYRSVPIVSKKSVPCTGTKSGYCTGSALIVLQAEEARINDHIDHQIKANRTEYESLLVKFTQTPAQSLCLSSVFIQQVISTLQHQVKIDPSIAEIGVELFYYILSKVTDDTSNFLPTKRLLTTCLEQLGQSHISDNEMEMPRLLNKILQEPKLGMYLAPHFTPCNVGIANFLLMYSTISKEMADKHDVTFALLSKFDMSKWLKSKKPKLSQRSQCIGFIISALTKIGIDPVESLILHEVYRKHLLAIFTHQFPEHYGEILMILLKSSNMAADSGCVAVTVWSDILGALAIPTKMELGIYRDQLRQYAHKQQTLQYQELLETAKLLCQHFTNERFQYGLYGLYPKTRAYVDVFALFLGMTGHALIISALNTHEGMLGDKLCEIIWPNLRDIFAPWLIPYWMQNMKENMATWIQQLADDRSVLLPWIPGDAPFAQKMAQVFFECVLFIVQTLPACHNILSFMWQWYVTNFANTTVKDHILSVIHTTFLGLPWHNFWPTITDLELMVKVVDQYLPECHTFLGLIFVEISWHTWLYSLSDNTPIQIKTRIYNCLLILIIKLSNEPNVRSNCIEKAKALLVYAESYDWSLIDPVNFQQIMDWFVTSYDPMLLYKTDPMNLDFRVLQFLKHVAYYDKPLKNSHPTLLAKRHIFVRGYVKLVAVFANRHKTLLPTKESVLVSVMAAQLAHMEHVVSDQLELNVILAEYLSVLNQSVINSFLTQYYTDWFSSKSEQMTIVKAMFAMVAQTVEDCTSVAMLLEGGILSYFNNNAKGSWVDISSMINFHHSNQGEFIKALITKDCFLTLYALLMQKMQQRNEFRSILSTALDWLANVKPSETVEPKLPLIWSAILTISLEFCAEDEATSGGMLYRLSNILQQCSEEKETSKWGRGILGVIGMAKTQGFSLQFRFLCRALSGYILAQLPDMKGRPLTVRHVTNAINPVGQPGGNTECAKVLLKLDFGQSQGKIKDCAELALKQIQNPSNSLHNSGYFLSLMLSQFYSKSYLQDIR